MMTRSAASEEIVSEYSYVVPSSKQSVALQMGSATTNAHARLRIIFIAKDLRLSGRATASLAHLRFHHLKLSPWPLSARARL